MPGFKVFKDMITVLLWDNIAATNWNPLWSGTVRTPGPLNISVNHALSVYYGSSRRSWMTQLLFQDAVFSYSYYASKMEKYFLENNIEMLLIDNVPGHPPFIGNLHPNIQVVFLPLKPSFWCNQWIKELIAVFKTYHLRRTFGQAVATIEGDNEKTLAQFWRDCSICDCIKNLTGA